MRETLESVNSQSYKNWECIIIDDGSIDQSERIIKEFCDLDRRFRFYKRPANKSKGANACRNFGFSKITGEYIQYLDSDDILSSGKLEEQVDLLSNSTSNSVIICPWAAFTEDIQNNIFKNDPAIFKATQTPKDLFDTLGAKNFFLIPHCFLLRKEQVMAAGYWNEALSINQDGEFFSRLLLGVEEVICSPNCVAYYRRSNNSTSSYNSLTKANDVILSWKLIEIQHKVKYKLDKSLYVEGTKGMVFKNLLDAGYKGVAEKHKDFFRDQFKNHNRSIIKSGIKRKLSYLTGGNEKKDQSE